MSAALAPAPAPAPLPPPPPVPSSPLFRHLRAREASSVAARFRPAAPPRAFTLAIDNFYVKTAISSDGTALICGSSDSCVHMWDVTPRPQWTHNNRHPDPILLRGHELGVTAVTWCRTEFDQVASCSDDFTTRMWNVRKTRSEKKDSKASYVEDDDHAAIASKHLIGKAEFGLSRKLVVAPSDRRLEAQIAPNNSGLSSGAGRKFSDISQLLNQAPAPKSTASNPAEQLPRNVTNSVEEHSRSMTNDDGKARRQSATTASPAPRDGRVQTSLKAYFTRFSTAPTAVAEPAANSPLSNILRRSFTAQNVPARPSLRATEASGNRAQLDEEDVGSENIRPVAGATYAQEAAVGKKSKSGYSRQADIALARTKSAAPVARRAFGDPVRTAQQPHCRSAEPPAATSAGSVTSRKTVRATSSIAPLDDGEAGSNAFRRRESLHPLNAVVVVSSGREFCECGCRMIDDETCECVKYLSTIQTCNGGGKGKQEAPAAAGCNGEDKTKACLDLGIDKENVCVFHYRQFGLL
ncbi:hypothetical protein HDU82_004209 [Entophlyctis luteolus]|nr:hypothetical protein HDU82_004209 [Entophlyctis luteolus]